MICPRCARRLRTTRTTDAGTVIIREHRCPNPVCRYRNRTYERIVLQHIAPVKDSATRSVARK